jgi:hypothetical protein
MCQCSWKDSYGRAALLCFAFFSQLPCPPPGLGRPRLLRRTERWPRPGLARRYFVADAESSAIKFTHAFESPFLTGESIRHSPLAYVWLVGAALFVVCFTSRARKPTFYVFLLLLYKRVRRITSSSSGRPRRCVVRRCLIAWLERRFTVLCIAGIRQMFPCARTGHHCTHTPQHRIAAGRAICCCANWWPCRAAPRRAVPCRAKPCRAKPCRAKLCRAKPCHAVPSRATLHCAVLRCAAQARRSSRRRAP